MADMNDFIRGQLARQSPMGDYVMTVLGPKRRTTLAESFATDATQERLIAVRESDPDVFAMAMNADRTRALGMYEAAKAAHEEASR